MPSAKVARHFLFKHPLFRKHETEQGIWWEQSVYYLWWCFLRRHAGYKRACQNGGRGRFKRLYRDFGDVHATDFKTWWTRGERGAQLFAELQLPSSVAALSFEDVQELSGAIKSGAVLLVAVPLEMRKRLIYQRFLKLIDTHHPSKRGDKLITHSKGLYPIARSFIFRSLHLALQAYDLKQSNRDLKLWQIGQQLQLGEQLTRDEINSARGRENPGAVSKKASLSAAAHRKIRMAEKLIDGVGKGRFPAYSD